MTVAIFGIDGGTLSLVERWQSELLNFRKFMKQGAYGTMISTVPALTCPAWPTMFTGKNPGKLGMYDFLNVDLNNGHARIMDSNDYFSDAIWNIASSNGKSVGLLNVPITYPPHKINGYMVCGLGTPEIENVVYTYPPSLQMELERLKYKITPNVLITLYGQEDKCIANVKELLKARVAIAKKLLAENVVDLFVCVFFVTDVVQHYFWRYMDTAHPRYVDGRYASVIKDVYRAVDSAVGQLMGYFPKDTAFLLVSDHGFGACYGGLSINRWLEKVGYLNFNGGNRMRRIYKVRDFVLSHTNPKLVDFMVKIMPSSLVNSLTTSGQAKDIVRALSEAVDWKSTKAFVMGTSGGGIYVNLKGRHPYGIVEPQEYEAVRDGLIRELHDFGLRAFRKEDVYHGRFLELAPDVAIELGSGFYYPTTLDRNTVLLNYAASGAHIPQAMFMAYGSGIKPVGRLPDLSIYDVAPTVLDLMGVDVPKDVDGRVLEEIIQSGTATKSKEGE